MIYTGQNIIRGGFAMKKFIRLLGFALLLVLIAFVGLIAYSANFDPNAVCSSQNLNLLEHL